MTLREQTRLLGFARHILEAIEREDLGDVVENEFNNFHLEWTLADEYRLARILGDWLDRQ